MPSSRQLRVAGIAIFLTVLVLYYISNGASNTYDSAFYRNTLAAIQTKKDAAAREDLFQEEKARLDRVERLRVEHDAAVAINPTESSPGAALPPKQQPIVQDVDAPMPSINTDGEKSVAGRKKMKDDKIVHGKPKTDDDDGVAKVGNVDTQTSNTAGGDKETEEEHKIKIELDDILKKGPIIVFSKTFCPFSKKAKDILLNRYKISPPPYVVELDQHELGPGLQQALGRSTGRKTVPNILINGKSIGGGDDVEDLHLKGKLIETIQSMGGKRIMSITNTSDQPDGLKRSEVKFKA